MSYPFNLIIGALILVTWLIGYVAILIGAFRDEEENNEIR